MNKRQNRLAQIVDLLIHNNVGSQEELLTLLLQKQCKITQATLSRDLKTLRTSKIATEMGGYRYVIASNGPSVEELRAAATRAASRRNKIISVARSGSLIVIKTRIGYAPGLAFDIDMMNNDHLIGTIAGSDTLFVAVNPGSPAREVFSALSVILPPEVLDECRSQFIKQKT